VDPSRRALLQALAAVGAGAATGCTPVYSASRLGPATPPQVLGPFHPHGATLATCYPPTPNNDLATVAGQAPAEGLRLYLRGTLRDGEASVPGATVEIWQTCHRGRYAHPDDEYGRRIPRDPGFQYYGTCTTDADGRYLFRSVMPRRYPAGFPGDRAWWRPPHVHFRVRVDGERRLTTQVYFRDPSDLENSWNHVAAQDADRLLAGLPEDRRDELICELAEATADDELAAALVADPMPTDGDDGPWGVARSGVFDLRIDRPSAGEILYPEVPAGHPRSSGRKTC